MSRLPFVRIPSHVDAERLCEAAESLERKLHARLPEIQKQLFNLRPDYSNSIIPDPNLPAGYWSEWIGRKMGNVLSYLHVYVYIISMAIPPSRRLADLSLLDYGGGWGMMSLLAKETGVGQVTYHDIEPGIAAAVTITSEVLGLPLDAYICGTEHALYSQDKRFDAVVSSDVLEHVYDPVSVFKAIRHVCKPEAYVFHHTGANPKCAYQRFTLSRLHRTEEKRLLQQRRDFISARATIPEPDLTRLATSTRGLNGSDLAQAMETYLETGAMPTPDHPTNTCELWGYWQERLMNPYDVAKKMESCGFHSRVTQAFWGPGRSRAPVRAVKHALNFVSSLSVPVGLRATFYYGIHGIAR